MLSSKRSSALSGLRIEDGLSTSADTRRVEVIELWRGVLDSTLR